MKREVLIIDDDPIFRNSIRHTLGERSYIFLEASSVEEGVRIVNEKLQVRVVMLDLSFPGGKGTDFLKRIKDRASNYRVIVLTGHEELLAAEIARDYDVFNYLSKPFSIQSLRFAVEQAFKDIERELLIKKIERLLEIQNRINSDHDLSKILTLICESVLDLVGGYTCHIRLYNLNKGDFGLAAFSGKVENIESIFDKPRETGEPFSGIVAITKQPEYFDDLQNDDEFKKFKDRVLASDRATREVRDYFDAVQSAYIVPISTGIFNTEVDAVLNISSDSKSFFTEERRSLVSWFVTQASLAISKNWLRERRDIAHQDYSRISRMLNEVSDKLKGPVKLDHIYDVVIEGISEIVNAETVSIFKLNEGTGVLESVAELRGNEKISSPKESYKPGRSLTGSVYADEETIRIPNNLERTKPTEDSRYDGSCGEKFLENIPSRRLDHYLGVPIRIGDKTFGVLRAINKKSEYYEKVDIIKTKLCLLDRGFSEECQNVLEITASHLAVAIRNAELINKLHRKVRQLETLNSVGQLIGSEMKTDDLLKLTIEQTAKVMQAEICMLYLKNRTGKKVRLIQCYGMPKIEGAFYDIGRGLTGTVAQNGVPILKAEAGINDGKYDHEILAFLRDQHGKDKLIESLMVVPIVAKGKILGVIKVLNKLGDRLQYDEEDLKFFETFASYVGVAVENAEIYDLTNKKLAIAERNAILSHLVGSVAHEINNTSGLIPANIQAIRATLPCSDESIEEMLDLIEDSARQIIDFANELAGFSRIGERKTLDIGEVIKKAIAQSMPDLQKIENFQNISLEINLSQEPIICSIYETPFIQIVRNIVINAYQAMENSKKGMLRINSFRDLSQKIAKIEFLDTGQGIRQKDIDKIFHPDFTTKERGNGLGLWLVKNHLDRLGGSISVKSTLNKGTTFSIQIPIGHSTQPLERAYEQ